MQIFEASKTELSGTILDLGGNDFSHNISNYFNGNYVIQFADKFPKDEKTIIWNDRNINVDWGNNNPIISKKDSKGVNLENAEIFI